LNTWSVMAIAGLVTYGVCLQEYGFLQPSPLMTMLADNIICRVTHWSGPVIAFGTASCGLQIIINVINTYCIDCYRDYPVDFTSFLNIGRQVMGFTSVFWIPSLMASVGYGLGMGILAIVCFVFYLAVSSR